MNITDLKPLEKANHVMTDLDLSDVYFYNSPEERWIYKIGSNGLLKYEYKTWQYYTYNAVKAIELVKRGYAMWNEEAVAIQADGQIRYNIDTLRVY